MLTHIYDEQLHYLVTLNYDYDEFIKKPSYYFPGWRNEYHATTKLFKMPIIKDGKIVETNREELILEHNRLDLLRDGEYVGYDQVQQKQSLLKIEKPVNLYKPIWDVNSHQWKEGMSQNEITKFRKEQIYKYGGEELIRAIEGFVEEKYDPLLVYLNDTGTKKLGYCYLDRKSPGIFKCIKETKEKVNSLDFFQKVSIRNNVQVVNTIVKSNDEINQNSNSNKIKLYKLSEDGSFDTNNEEELVSTISVDRNNNLYISNEKNNVSIILNNDGTITYPAKNLTTESKDLVSAINEIVNKNTKQDEDLKIKSKEYDKQFDFLKENINFVQIDGIKTNISEKFSNILEELVTIKNSIQSNTQLSSQNQSDISNLKENISSNMNYNSIVEKLKKELEDIGENSNASKLTFRFFDQ